MTVSQRISVVDSHTGGEPTRVVIAGGPDLGTGGMAGRRAVFRERFDPFRSAVVNEPRGSDVMVGAILCEPADPTCAAGLIFFNNVGTLGMCGHGTIGVAVALAHLGRIAPGVHRFETPVGVVAVTLEDVHHAAIDNVASYRTAKGVEVQVPGLGRFVGDVAWGGNWFFLVRDSDRIPPLRLDQVEGLTDLTWRIRQALVRQGVTGALGAEIDHVEVFGPPDRPENHSRNFVLCPGKAYDRSPCGTGTSAKLACLAADGKLAEGATWVQESIIGSTFSASYRWLDRAAGKVIPSIRGTAYITAESTLLLDERDPFCWGIR
jgi:4-hydroxyproline epimerase